MPCFSKMQKQTQPVPGTFLLLASRSPRRSEILKKLSLPFRVISSSYKERRIRGLRPHELVIRHAVSKAKKANSNKKAWILGADTLVFRGKKILGKPKTIVEARKMLALLSGKVHDVYTGLALYHPAQKKLITGFSRTRVQFKKLTSKDIKNYMRQVNPFDKAGAYAIQEGPKIVKKMRGSYSNVIGLPVELLKKMLNKSSPLPKPTGSRLPPATWNR
ncbi:MAG: septum formation protein Maf [Candidatus Omnitrophica bacterium]|nr:septum formation protein Maf [Candidatus Omnitrophota bacterium]